jgi:hypothetical protein
MSAPINDGGPAFPHFKFAENGKMEICPQGGMTLRDYFAAQALLGVLVSPKYAQASTNDVVECAYWFADAMLDERMEEPK